MAGDFAWGRVRLIGGMMILGMLAACGGSNAQLDQSLTDLTALERPSSPNTYLACPAGYSTAAIDREMPAYGVPLAQLQETWLNGLAEEPRTEQLAADLPTNRFLYVQRSALIGFPDLIRIDFLATDANGSTVCVYSRSVYGYSDLGVNRERVEDWLRRFSPEG